MTLNRFEVEKYLTKQEESMPVLSITVNRHGHISLVVDPEEKAGKHYSVYLDDKDSGFLRVVHGYLERFANTLQNDIGKRSESETKLNKQLCSVATMQKVLIDITPPNWIDDDE